jgi:hypothetical protein
MSENEKKAIEKLKGRVKIDRQLRDKVESDFDKFCEDECIAIEIVLNLVGKQQKEIDKQNKVIYLMAKMIEAHDIDEDICRQVRNTDCNDYEDKQKCIECIKQYFIRKVEGDDKN